MKVKRSIGVLLAIMLTATSIVGCTTKGGEDGPKEATNTRKENNELVAAVAVEPTDGLDATVGGHGSMTRVFFSTLFKRDKQLGMENDLATGYEVSEDKLTWTVKLREDAKFTDGEKLTAEDIVFTYDTAKKSGSSIDLTVLESVSAKDEYTVKFKLTEPQSIFIEKLASVGIVPKHAYNAEFANNPIGSGPYKFVQWDKGQQVIAIANENYYGEKPGIEKLTLVFLGGDAAYAAVKSGDVDVASIPGSFAKEKVPGKEIITLDSIETYGVEFPMQASGQKSEKGYPIGNDVTSDKAIREALNYAIDREELVEGVLEGYGKISTTGLEQMPWLNEETVLTGDGDIEKAKQILADGGWKDTDSDGIVEKNGKDAQFKLLYTDGMYRQDLGLAVSETAKQIGIKIELELKTWDNIEPEINSQAVLFGWGSGDPSELHSLYSSEVLGKGAPWNNAGYYKNNTVDKYLDQAMQSEDEGKAMEFWKKAQWDGKTGYSTKGDCTYAWLVNAGHIYIADENLNIGKPVVQPHGGRILDNITEWSWE
ncbi:ABC transporter substrate-binding protein [Romboutsia sp.]|uniref:ABC transporter substrate-binding protein n=1 Tax=Romboutsia sp. TaxID=1965302 RepID=UPI003F37DA78